MKEKSPMENEPIEYPDDTGKMDGWRKDRPGKFRNDKTHGPT